MSRVAEILLQQGRDAARAAEASGQIWGNTITNIGQIPGQVVAQQQQQKRLSQEDEARAIAVRTAKRGEADTLALDTAFQQPTREEIISSLPGHLRPSVTKQFADADAAALKVKESRKKIDEADNEYLAGLGQSVVEHGYDLSAAGLALMHARNTYENDPELLKRIDGIATQIQSNPDSLKDIADRLVSLSPKRMEIQQKATHDAVTEASTTAQRDETARHNAALEMIAKTTGDRQATTAAETARHNKAMEAHAASLEGAAPELSPEGLSLASRQYAMTGQLPPMGMGKQGARVRTQIINNAADIYKNLDLPSQTAAYKANQESLKKIQVQRDALGAFEETALKNLGVFLGAAAKVPDTGSPLFNKPLRGLTENVFGGADLTAYNTARRTVIPEFAKILANPGLSGQLSDSARKEIEEVVSGNATLKQTIAAANVLKQDVENRRTAYDDQIKEITKRIATPPGQPAAPNTADVRILSITPVKK